MRHYAKILILFFSICLFSSFKATDTKEINTYNSCDDLIKTWTGVIFGTTVHFNSISCAENAGATNIQPGGLWPSCSTFTCI
ncbi:hypothetical protein [uncultured Olleya sp.]|uniref:hypothetical protein n=1 Tax=uncultured Olleya sp. TaxID=757243 RepID=UPI002598F544|nr:hypothetical protein [uncultured Olleya sp.]